MKKTLREWKMLWESWDINDDANLEQLFTDAGLEEEKWDMLCEMDLILTTVDGNIGLAEVRIFDEEEGSILVAYKYKIPYEMDRSELINLIESINNDDEDDNGYEEPGSGLENDATA